MLSLACDTPYPNDQQTDDANVETAIQAARIKDDDWMQKLLELDKEHLHIGGEKYGEKLHYGDRDVSKVMVQVKRRLRAPNHRPPPPSWSRLLRAHLVLLYRPNFQPRKARRTTCLRLDQVPTSGDRLSIEETVSACLQLRHVASLEVSFRRDGVDVERGRRGVIVLQRLLGDGSEWMDGSGLSVWKRVICVVIVTGEKANATRSEH
ncbi:hypothetical protein BJV74DRAFT_986526 [Russula compacta]|nr:hypothetical protein BJV74DRAFT_986526 [Russula compacta]